MGCNPSLSHPSLLLSNASHPFLNILGYQQEFQENHLWFWTMLKYYAVACGTSGSPVAQHVCMNVCMTGMEKKVWRQLKEVTYQCKSTLLFLHLLCAGTNFTMSAGNSFFIFICVEATNWSKFNCKAVFLVCRTENSILFSDEFGSRSKSLGVVIHAWVEPRLC